MHSVLAVFRGKPRKNTAYVRKDAFAEFGAFLDDFVWRLVRFRESLYYQEEHQESGQGLHTHPHFALLRDLQVLSKLNVDEDESSSIQSRPQHRLVTYLVSYFAFTVCASCETQVMAPVLIDSSYHWTAGDIIGPVTFLGFMISILMLLFWNKARCCISCCVFVGNLRGKTAGDNRRSCAKSAPHKSSYVASKPAAGRGSYPDARDTENNHDQLETVSLSACPSSSEPVPHISSVIDEFEGQARGGKGGVPNPPIRVHLREECSGKGISRV